MTSKPPPISLLLSRGAAIVAFISLLLITLIGYVTPAYATIVLGLLFTDGTMALVWVACAASLGSALLNLIKIENRGVLEWATAAALGLGFISLAVLALGLAGWLNFTTAAGLLLIAAILEPRRKIAAIQKLRQASAGDWLRQPAGWHWLWLLIAPLLAIALTGASMAPGFLWKNQGDPHPYDVLEYHLQLAREWFELGRIVPLHHNVFSYFPLNAEMQSLLAMHLRRGAWKGMYLAQFVQTASMGIAVLVVYGAIRRLRPQRVELPAILAAMSMVATPWIVMLGSVAYDESALLLYGTCAVVWAMVGMKQTTHRRTIFGLAGMLAGMACGVKYTAAPFLLLGIPIAAAVAAFTGGNAPRFQNSVVRPPPISRLSQVQFGLIFVIAGILAFSPWLIRNTVWAKNPVFPLAMRQLGQAHFTDAQVKRFELAHSPRRAQQPLAARLATARHELLIDWRFGYALWPLAIAAICRAGQRKEVWFLAILLLVIFIVWIGFTHLLGRFFVMAIPVAALLIGTFSGRNVCITALCLVVVMLLRGWLGVPGTTATSLHDAISEASETFGQKGGFALEDLHWLTPTMNVRDPSGRINEVDPDSAFADPHSTIGLIGNATPFFYNLPISRLTYRTVFDVDAAAPFPDAWLPADQRGHRPDRDSDD